ncbi:MAG: poly-beta-1,6-N-acetyl-D-glucosamine N-deacetylase PgaB [Burkholderiaceae bacterium]|nr:poly-beta-1,6-N-acetyl-D-glucosamine N-deacetylase PgaB [Burkholderiaceae bacterium]
MTPAWLRRRLCLLATALAASFVLPQASARAADMAPDAFLALSYHEVSDDGRAADAPGAGRYGIEISHLVAQFSWLRENGYHPVSLTRIAEARAGGAPLPPKAVLLSFDDGYADFHTHVYPVLELFGYPAVIALVGSWMDAAPGTLVDYDGKKVAREVFLSWAQVREMMASGLVEVASHSYALHRGVIANPQGNTQPAAVARIYDAATRRYESDEAWLGRIRDDLQRNARLIERETGKAPRAMVWPYGRYSLTTQRIARELGMPLMLTLEGGVNAARDPLDRIRRIIVESSPNLGEFVDEIERVWPEPPQRVVHVDLDYVYSADPAEQERNLSALLERIRAIQPSTVYLQAYADPDGDGEADALYFPSARMPMRADLFNRVAWQLETRVGVRVYAWMPVLAFRLPEGDPARDDLVQAARAQTGSPGAGSNYRRLSPFSARARAAITSIYADLGRHARFSGLLFHDDALLGDHEDDSPWARAVHRERWGLPGPVDAIRADPQAATEWSRRKLEWLVDFTHELAAATETFNAPLKTARNLYAAPVVDPAAQDWFAQSLPAFLKAYDFTALMAMPYLENAASPRHFLESLVGTVSAHPQGLARTVFELQARDWRGGQPVPDGELANWIRMLELAGATHIGYYPDDAHVDAPALRRLVPAFSLRAVPQP